VRLQATGGTYCIDSTEVTNAQYQAFLASGATPQSLGLPSPGCDGQMDLQPRDSAGNLQQFEPGQELFPVIYVDWCEAYGYCKWAGKRLCGQIGGGPLATGSPETNAVLSQWYNACSKGGALLYPYGNTYVQTTCGGGGGSTSPLGNVALRPGCVGGYPGLHDMSGNVWEWTDVCSGNMATDQCHVYGGAFDGSPPDLACTGVRYWRRNSSAGNIGFRCCEDVTSP
jgi:formylglycine-generating enzyme required for sulfatase activity